MWVIPSRSRPHNIERLITAWGSAPVWLRLDKDDPDLGRYLAIELPLGWMREAGPRVPLSLIYNEAYQRAPERAWWGIVGDDVVPRTPGWDARLIEIAGLDGMAVPAGGHGGTPHFVLGGDLVREMGWLSLPGLDRLYIDTVWGDIAHKKKVLRFAPDVILEHRHFSNGKAPFDRTYRKTRKPEDRAVYQAWSDTQEKTIG